MSSRVLAHFDQNVEIRLACDTSDYGMGAVLDVSSGETEW